MDPRAQVCSPTPAEPWSIPVRPSLRHASPSRVAALTTQMPRALAVLLAATLLIFGLAPTRAAAAGDGSSFDSPAPLPLTVLDGTFETTTEGRTIPQAVSGPPMWYYATWYEFTPSISGQITIEASSAFHNGLEVWNAARQPLGNTNYTPTTNSRLTMWFNAGMTYRLGFGSYGPASGTGPATLTFRPTQVPTAPTAVTATAGDQSALVTWSPATGIVRDYSLVCTTPGRIRFSCGTAAGNQFSATVTGLTNGQPTTIEVRAHNSAAFGAGPLSAAVEVTPRGTSSVVLTTDPAVVVSGEPFAVDATVTRSDGWMATGSATLVIAGESRTVELSGGGARVTGLTSPVGTVPVTVTYEGSTAVTGSSGTLDISVGRASQRVTIDEIDSLTYGHAPVTVSGSSTSGGPVTFAATGACTVSGDQLHATGAGECTLTASQAGTAQILPATASTTFMIAQLAQTLTLEVPELVYDQSADVETSSSADLPVTLTADGACTLTDGRLTATDVGTCTVTATQDGTADVSAAAPVVVDVQVERRTQDVTIAPIGDQLFAVEPVQVTATSSVGLPVTLTAAGACVIVEDLLFAITSGECTVTATQDGDEHTLPARASSSGRVTGTAAPATVVIDAEQGDDADGAPFVVLATGARPGTELVVTESTTARPLARVTVGADGTAVATGVLPPGLAAGEHRLVVSTVGPDGAPVQTELRFTVGADGTLAWIGSSALVAVPAPVAPPAPAPAPAPAPQPVTLATTGTDGTLPVALTAGVWLLLGAALLTVRRRRSTTA
ncbi:fibronectin type III domain-containing protein [Cellulomonas dongxiuzhuiae]|uniref:Fibronectin type III domain-containing protein n=1 Tax=Cellulomonas dongxiuzhuiae TaxID=2819979 RepID=A0ABX8GKI6_9CELL|nr:fibronectin type III domain-containing protein [Cellulomonas dongxiuzhuiae]MBO3095558.1 fibronectin type III domain-containing protein [Cellulomonas dongxiuzhuiae]QWC16530.1 fibronectin type III domain-containing protein [Cellulomonas dongxiuzhuiae]